MDKLKIQELLEICEQMGVSVHPAIDKMQDLEFLQNEEGCWEEDGVANKIIS